MTATEETLGKVATEVVRSGTIDLKRMTIREALDMEGLLVEDMVANSTLLEHPMVVVEHMEVVPMITQGPLILLHSTLETPVILACLITLSA
jgi:hypothetical protein